MSEMLRDELDIHVHGEVFCTDSQVILGNINTDFFCFKVFVANWVQQI